MALSKLLPVSLILSFLLLQHLIEDNQLVSSEGLHGSLTVERIDCNEACDVRCSKTSRPDLCKRACGTCCQRCNCVPPGYSGNQRACPCYYNQITHGGRRKCP
ncbi:hypothetical protein HN51_052010 [Arachis hypogaea]|uniref:snakin-2-like n=1 Tax=Arachis ipaensis TaxID=130454 RepID=UPI0007AF033A|nr:snakin-2-like [Arachis ipaensis]XP_016174404.1 snakin-2-like [Arachis ipaensis]XP_016182791.1 snakin-2-like [Arachis ipaensis]XP_025667629.1 snakin-2 [Arachis hypogaea]QHN93263.1 uncharacterized protein DS421_17g591180 [Arachis hypogaea]